MGTCTCGGSRCLCVSECVLSRLLLPSMYNVQVPGSPLSPSPVCKSKIEFEAPCGVLGLSGLSWVPALNSFCQLALRGRRTGRP